MPKTQPTSDLQAQWDADNEHAAAADAAVAAERTRVQMQAQHPAPTATRPAAAATKCRWDSKCYRKDCAFKHSTANCHFDEKCTRPGCTYRHSKPKHARAKVQRPEHVTLDAYTHPQRQTVPPPPAPTPAVAHPPPTPTPLTEFERKTLTVDNVTVDYRPGLEWANLEDPAAMKESGFCTKGQHVDAATHPHWPAVRRALIEAVPGIKKAFDKPTEIQCTALPRLLAPPGAVGAGCDMIFQAPTGTGKTGAFVGAALCAVDTAELAVQVLMLAPTRHIAEIHATTARALGQHIDGLEVRAYYRCATAERTGKGCRCAPGSAEQPHSSRRGSPPPCHVLTGTAGKLASTARGIDLSKIKVVVVDEADALFHDSKRSDETKKAATETEALCAAVRKANPSCKFILASATAPKRARKFYAAQFPYACTIYQEPETTMPDTITVATKALPDDAAAKSEWVSEWCSEGERAIVFANTRDEVVAIHAQFVQMGIHAGAIHGGMGRAAQDRALEDFKAAKTCVLVSSSIIERGIDLDGVTHVVLYRPPMKAGNSRPDYTAFVHKMGRCGRCGNSGVGVVITSSPEDEANLRLIAQHFSLDVVNLRGGDAEEDAEQLEDRRTGLAVSG